MTSSAEKFGSALAKAVKGVAAVMNEGKQAPVMYRTNLHEVPEVEGLKRQDGWVDMQVQFLMTRNLQVPTILSVGPCSNQARGTRTIGIAIATGFSFSSRARA